MQDTHAYAAKPIEELYRWFAVETEPTSPTWGRLCRWIAEQPELCARLDTLPGRKRQPNLFLAALRYLRAPLTPGAEFLVWVEEHWPAVQAVVLARRTQTNEPGRLAVIAPLLAALPQPIALLELGSSAGLCLLPDRFRYRVGGVVVDGAGVGAGDEVASPVLECQHEGEPPASPAGLRVAYRCGLDASPLNPVDVDDARWLRALVWPGEGSRESVLAAALRVAAADPPIVARGSLPADLPGLLDSLPQWLEELPSGTTPVVMHSATLAYLDREGRDAVEAMLRASAARWVSFEGPTVVSGLRAGGLRESRPHFLLALDGDSVAVASPHGSWARWL